MGSHKGFVHKSTKVLSAFSEQTLEVTPEVGARHSELGTQSTGDASVTGRYPCLRRSRWATSTEQKSERGRSVRV